MTHNELVNLFTYHPPTGEQVKHYAAIRSAGLALAETILTHVPSGADQSTAVRKVREAVMTANAGIACHVVKDVPHEVARGCATKVIELGDETGG